MAVHWPTPSIVRFISDQSLCQNSSFVLFVTEFSYHMYRKNAVLNGKQKQMKPLQKGAPGVLSKLYVIS